MKRIAAAAVVLGAFALAAGAAQSSKGAPTSTKAEPVSLTIWAPWTARELNEFKKVVGMYDKAHPRA